MNLRESNIFILPVLLSASILLSGCGTSRSNSEENETTEEATQTVSSEKDATVQKAVPGTESTAIKSTEEAAVSAEDTFSTFIGNTDFLYGKNYNTYVRKNDSSENPYQYDLSEIPTTNMGYQVYDFDGDGQDELLVVKIKSDYSLQLDMYEYENGAAELSASWDAEDQTHYYEDDDSIHVARGLPGHLDCFIYEDGDNIRIALEENYSGVVASGTSICFSVVEYNNTFNEAGGEFIIGSGLLEEDGTEFKNGIEKLGAKGVVFEDIWEGNSEVIDYMPSVYEICRQDSALLLSTDELIELSENGIDKPVTNVKFLSRDELFTGNGKYYGIQQSSSEGDTNSDNIYESDTVKNEFLSAVSGTWECATRGMVPDHLEEPEWTATFSEDKINYTDYTGYEYSANIAHVVSTDEGYLIQCISDNGSHFAYSMNSDCTSALYVDGWEVTSTNTYGDEGMFKAD